MEQTFEQIMDVTVKYGLDVIGAIFILIAGRIGAGVVRKVIRRALGKAQVDQTIKGFAGRFAGRVDFVRHHLFEQGFHERGYHS